MPPKSSEITDERQAAIEQVRELEERLSDLALNASRFGLDHHYQMALIVASRALRHAIGINDGSADNIHELYRVAVGTSGKSNDRNSSLRRELVWAITGQALGNQRDGGQRRTRIPEGESAPMVQTPAELLNLIFGTPNSKPEIAASLALQKFAECVLDDSVTLVLLSDAKTIELTAKVISALRSGNKRQTGIDGATLLKQLGIDGKWADVKGVERSARYKKT
jgi:hypothetical protein